MRKKLIIIFSFAISVIMIVSISAFAYFAISNSSTLTINRDLNDDIIEISSFDELIEYSKATKYNDHNESSDVSSDTASRRTLQLKKDIILHNNIEITTDCNIDLNEKKLYLNGYNLSINHAYYGTYQLYDGTIYPEQITVSDDGTITAKDDATSGVISINTPNAIIINNGLTSKSITGTTLALSNCIHTYSFSSLYAGYYALYTVADNLVDYADLRPNKLLPGNIKEGTTISKTENTYTFNSSLFIPKRSDNTYYSFIYKDIDLPFNYLNFDDIIIEYSSNTKTVVSDFGEVTLPSTSNNSVTLTANVKYNGNIIATSTFNLHVINPDSDAILDAAEEIFYSRILDHYDSENEIYVFDREVFLPKLIGSATLSYTPYKESTADGAVAIFNDSKKYLSLGDSNVSDFNDYIVDFSPTSESAALRVVITKGTSTKTIYIKMTSSNMVVNNEYSIAKDIINDWYGGKITLTKTDENNYSTKILKQYSDIDHEKYPTVTALNYTIINDTHNLYGITSNILGVNTGKHPENYVQNVMLSCNFTINGKNIPIQIPVVVDLNESTLANEFLPYYTYYDELVKYSYNNYVSQSFEMPFAYSATGPIICYDFAVLPSGYDSKSDKTLTEINPAIADAFKVKLYYNGSVQKTFTYSNNTSYTAQLDSALADLNITLQQIFAYGDAKWIYELDIEKVPNSNTNMALIYNYKMTYAANAWTIYCENNTDDQKITKFVLAGILHHGSDVVDETFYKWIYDNFTILTDTNNDKLVYTIGDYNKAKTDSSTGKYVIIDWLEQNVAVDYTTDSTIGSINDFTGLQFLVGTKYLNLTGAITDATIAINVAREISKMRNLETLILKNCSGFTDGKITWAAENTDNDSISRFVKLKNLKVLNVEGCNIVLFDFMDSMTWLNEVHIANQVVDSNQYYSNIYGNRGIVNLWIFGDLTDAGVKVYNTYQGTGEVLFEEQKDLNDYLRLKQGVVYQSKLAYGVDIKNLFSSFSTTVTDYHMDKYYRNNVSGGQLNITSKEIKFEPVLNTTYLKAGTYDANATYYVINVDGYSIVETNKEADFASYYIADLDVKYTKATGTYDASATYYVVDSDSSTGYSEVETNSEANFGTYYIRVLDTKYIKANATYDASAIYYVVDEDSSIGYSQVTTNNEEDFDSYYIAVTETPINCKAFVGIYNFELASNICYLKVKFNVERY